MYFLSNAVYVSGEDSMKSSLYGVTVVKYTTDICSRPIQEFVQIDNIDGLEDKIGFEMRNGLLFSEAHSRLDVEEATASYIMQEINASSRYHTYGLQDALKFCLMCGGTVLAQKEGKGEYALIPLSRFKSSNSSFNIYASYAWNAEEFRTISLIDVESAKSKMFTVAIGKDIEIPRELSSFFFRSENDFSDVIGENSVAYNVSAQLVGADNFMGESFCNYLAYNIAFYKIGIETCNEFYSYLSESPSNKEEKKGSSDKKYSSRAKRIPAPSMSIVCEIKNSKAKEMLNVLSNEGYGSFLDLSNSSIEHNLTSKWIELVREIGSQRDGDDAVKNCRAACLLIEDSARVNLLKYELDLLSQRVYLSSLGELCDPLPRNYFQGGGTDAISFKKFIG